MWGPTQEARAIRHAFRDVPAVPGISHKGVRVLVQDPITSEWVDCPAGTDYTDAMVKAQEYVATRKDWEGFSL